MSRTAQVFIAIATALASLAAAVTAVHQAADWWASTTASPSEIDRTPRMGMQFWQAGALARMSVSPGVHETVQVSLKREPFEMWFPAAGDKAEIDVSAWTDSSIFNIVSGADINQPQGPFSYGAGVADDPYGSGTLFVDNQGHNALFKGRLVPAAEGMVKIYVSRLWEGHQAVPLAQTRGDLFLAAYVDRNNDHRFDVGNYEYIVLHLG